MTQPTPSRGAPASSLAAAAALWELVRSRGGVSRALDPDYRRFSALVEGFGGPRDALDRWTSVGGSELGELFPSDDVESALARAMQLTSGWSASEQSILVLGDLCYPMALAEISDAPPFLFVEGVVEGLYSPSIAIVGARKASEDGRRRARRAAQVVVEAGYSVVSGLAIGIDTSAHEATLAVGGRTVAVMGTPLERRYPAENSNLADRIVGSGGAVVSEFVPGTATKPWHFVRRNRTMSGLVAATLVIEASETSGARSQAHAALEQGRPVFLPTSLITRHEWARRLVEDGRRGLHAIEVERPEQIVELLNGNTDLAESSESY